MNEQMLHIIENFGEFCEITVICCRVALQFYQKMTSSEVLFCGFFEMFQKSILTETAWILPLNIDFKLSRLKNKLTVTVNDTNKDSSNKVDLVNFVGFIQNREKNNIEVYEILCADRVAWTCFIKKIF